MKGAAERGIIQPMTSFLELLQGSYAYLLIFQIVIVTMLLLSLLWLIARRLREPAVPDPVSTVPDESILRLSREQATKIQALESQISELEKGGATLVQAGEKSKALQDKVTYLEQKLLEYEILQEEISTLSLLKVENEKLKAQVVQLGGSGGRASSTPTAPAPSGGQFSSDSPTTGLKPFDDVSDDKPAKGTLAQDEIDGLIAKIDSLSTKR